MKKSSEPATLRERFATNLRRYRVQQGMSQEELGSYIGADRTAISRLERTFGNPTLERAEALASALDIDVRVLMAFSGKGEIERQPPTGDVSSAAVGAKVARLREKMGLTQKQLGELAGVDRNFISRIEAPHGRGTPLELATLEKLAAAFGIHPVELL
ncbi:helix-turn-helix domain-containing protein [Paraburkholderia graminis]|uniref:Transcriptional regulator with XRE-family HTH domain n=1 Tax=Paraburkholderia graminis TaxID=60548 RepID=A0ABD5CJE7_9BURK|nr:helix-turn-helix transcriptional regulator [Paraburkholderia graminis]MDR6205448.1 transcriptional regulator with XRE-family HTH domain [Paraburkholderia graminis]